MALSVSTITEDFDANDSQANETEKCLMVADLIDKHLRKYCENNMVNSTNFQNVGVGSTKIKGKGPIVLSFEEYRPIKSLRTKISSRPNVNLKYTSPIHILDKEEKISDDEYHVFYFAMKRKKNSNDQDGSCESDSDSGMGDSGNSRSVDSPEIHEDEQISQKKESTKEQFMPKLHKNVNKSKGFMSRKRDIEAAFERKINVKNSKNNKPIWFIPGNNSFHVNVNPIFSSHQPKCYSFQSRPHVRNVKANPK